MIAPVTVAGILIMAILANQALAYSSYNYSYKSYKGHHGNYYKTSKYTRHGNVRASNTGNVAQGASNTGNGATSQESSNTGNGRTNSFVLNSPTPSQQSSNTGNGRTNSFVLNSPTPSQENSNTGNTAQGASNNGNTADFSKTILDIHNRERAAVSVPPLVWSDKLANDAKTWVEHLARLGSLVHSGGSGQGENLSYRSSSGGPSTISTAQLIQGWISEKNDYHGAPIVKGGQVTGHYTQMVWRTTTAVGCATASAGQSVYLVCRYSPPGNMLGERPY
jgi:pathogenesis-related protein 1